MRLHIYESLILNSTQEQKSFQWYQINRFAIN